MKTDNLTQELPGLPKKRGRPATGKTTTSAERMRKMRDQREAEIIEAHDWHFNQLGMNTTLACQSMARHAECNDWQGVKHAWLAIGRREGWL